jgi:hypothetical protein
MYGVMTHEGVVAMMLVDDTIVAYRERGDVLVHHVPARVPSRPGARDSSFAGIHESRSATVVRIFHPTELVIGCCVPEVRAELEWGYVWTVDAPGNSSWVPADSIVAAIDPTDLPVEGTLKRLAHRIRRLAIDTAEVDPRAVALAAGWVNDLPYEALDPIEFEQWLDTYGKARVQANHFLEED